MSPDHSLTLSVASEWQRRAGLFPELNLQASRVEQVGIAEVPEPYKRLLAHNNLMTLTLERFYGALVDLCVLARRLDGTLYSRAIVLARRDTGAILQFALGHFDFTAVSEAIRDDVLSERIPLGRLLLNQRVECRIELVALFNIAIEQGLAKLLAAPVDIVTYGRAARILCNGKPGFDVIEISAPIDL